jgi:Protein of unknown function (DUF3102)
MKKLELIKPGGARQNDLAQLAREINDAQDVIDSLEAETKRKGFEWQGYVIEQGQRLLQVKEIVGHGNWLVWLKAHCPLSARSANVYMRVASNQQRVADLGDASLRQMTRYLADTEPRDATTTTAKSWPAFVDCISRFAKAMGFEAKHPIKTWPSEGRDKLRSMLRPLFESLYPENF